MEDIQEDANAFDTGLVLELTPEEMERRKHELGEEFEIVAVNSDGEEEKGGAGDPVHVHRL